MYQMRIRVVSVIDVNNNIIDNIHINGPSDHPISPEFNPANNKLYAESWEEIRLTMPNRSSMDSPCPGQTNQDKVPNCK
jgi:hypothetical protein